MSRLIGLVGASGSGKTTLASLLVERHGYVRAHMGQPIKDMLAALGLNTAELTGPPEIRSRPSNLLGGKSPRYAMQTLGTDWGRRMISPRIWANAVERRLREHLAIGSSPIVIDDLRFPTDWAMVERLEGMIVRIVRPGVSMSRTLADHLAHNSRFLQRSLAALRIRFAHETEYHWHDAPAVIELVNDGSPEKMLASLLTSIGSEHANLGLLQRNES